MAKEFNGQQLTNDWIATLIKEKSQLSIGPSAQEKIRKCFDYLHQKIKNSTEPIYGINTGFGSLCDTKISNDQLQQLQENLVKSHACGFGNEVSVSIVKTMMALKVINMSLGHSGVKPETANLMAELFNRDIIPVIYEQGSLGASGDLAPLAHLSLPLIGLGEVNYKGEKVPTSKAFSEEKLTPIKLDAKEGLALLNGTQFMCAYGVTILNEAKSLLDLANLIASVSIEAFDGKPDPFNALIHKVRPHKGQEYVASQIRTNLNGSKIHSGEKIYVQDPYSFRCIPQVHGASYDTIQHVNSVFETEINSVSDNPTIFPDEDVIISGGNFHGQPLAIALDTLSIALAEIGSISERRTYKLISGTRGLPPFLVKTPGLNSGFMIPQYTAASIASQNKQLCTPASIDSIDSSNGQEDHVSMGANAATKCYTVLQNTKRILSIELLNAMQALEFRKPLTSSAKIESLQTAYRKEIPFVDNDVYMHELMAKSLDFLNKQL